VQKINKNASILIWAIFLSLIISISFLSISTKITKNLKTNNSLNREISEQNDINNILKTSENDIEQIWNYKIYIENKNLKKSLKKDEIYEITFPEQSNITLNITNSWILLYNTWWTNTWILYNNLLNLNSTINTWEILKLINLSWITSFELISNNKFDIPEKNYKIVEIIWNKQIIKSNWILK